MTASFPSFKCCLMSISNELTGEDFEKMKFVLLDYLPRGKLQIVKEPYELFSLMIENELLSEENTGLLSNLLKSVGKIHLNNLLQDFFAQFQQPLGELYVCKLLFVLSTEINICKIPVDASGPCHEIFLFSVFCDYLILFGAFTVLCRVDCVHCSELGRSTHCATMG